METLKFIFISLILLSFFGCKKKEVDELQFEKDVINSVFLEVVDSIYMDRRIISPPPPPRFNSETNKVDTTGHRKELKEYWHHRDSIKNDKARILIAVNDLVGKISRFDKELLDENCKKIHCIYDKTKERKSLKFDLIPFKNNKKFDFQYLSKFPKFDTGNYQIYPTPVGSIEISRIQFNKTKTRGILPADASCGGGKCGRGFLIIIENKSGKWKIAKVIHTWVS